MTPVFCPIFHLSCGVSLEVCFWNEFLIEFRDVEAVTELELYCKVDPEIMEDANPVENFDSKTKTVNPKLYRGLGLLGLSDHISPSERASSQCTTATKGFKGAISDENLEKIVMLKMNKKLIDQTEQKIDTMHFALNIILGIT